MKITESFVKDFNERAKRDLIGKLATERNQLRYEAYFLKENTPEALSLDTRASEIQDQINEIRNSEEVEPA